ncbi:hypothetical protein KC678_05485 [Candidatus Dojkabacteria bacterium]|uniref:Uncharacterized protein n=1 Tax=Candidatus Dojkabacteria bacterium TaxID=2099670 RepID=A0A955L2K0_9BACT|nr:hypothetical protein [Candidatus Dojkabacteria bacterium]
MNKQWEVFEEPQDPANANFQETAELTLDAVEELILEYLESEEIELINGVIITQSTSNNSMLLLLSNKFQQSEVFPTYVDEILSELIIKTYTDGRPNPEYGQLRARISGAKFIYGQIKALNDMLMHISDPKFSRYSDVDLLTDELNQYPNPRMVDYLVKANEICRKLQKAGYITLANQSWEKIDMVMRDILSAENGEWGKMTWEDYVILTTDLLTRKLEGRKDLHRLNLEDLEIIITKLNETNQFVDENINNMRIHLFNTSVRRVIRSIHKKISHLDTIENAHLDDLLNLDPKKLQEVGEEIILLRNKIKQLESLQLRIPNGEALVRDFVQRYNYDFNRSTRIKTFDRIIDLYDSLRQIPIFQYEEELSIRVEQIIDKVMEGINQKIEYLQDRYNSLRRRGSETKGTIALENIETLRNLESRII